MSTKSEIAYHFVGKKLRFDGRAIPKDGVWLKHKGDIDLCESGLHASKHPFDALEYAPGRTLCKVQVRGKIIHDDNKLVATERMIVARFDATELLWKFSRLCALDVIDKWDAPEIVVKYLKTGDESLRDAASDAASDATSAAWDSASDAASMAASMAAWAASAAASATRAATGAATSAATWAASAAAWDAASDATSDAARAAQRKRFARMVRAEFARKP